MARYTYAGVRDMTRVAQHRHNVFVSSMDVPVDASMTECPKERQNYFLYTSPPLSAIVATVCTIRTLGRTIPHAHYERYLMHNINDNTCTTSTIPHARHGDNTCTTSTISHAQHHDTTRTPSRYHMHNMNDTTRTQTISHLHTP